MPNVLALNRAHERRHAIVREELCLESLGMFDGDEIMKEIIEEGRRIRVEDREKTDS